MPALVGLIVHVVTYLSKLIPTLFLKCTLGTQSRSGNRKVPLESMHVSINTAQ